MRAQSFWKSKRATILILAFLTLGAFVLRVYHLSSAGLAEDEVHKLMAVQSYLNGDFTANAEHPLLMKLLDTGMIVLAHHWNHLVSGQDLPTISDEFAIRFPNVLFGALTTIILYLLARDLFSRRVGLLSALLWATGINAIIYNRIAKEDTLLVFFVLHAFYFYYRAKNVKPRDPRVENRWYAASGGAFGMMMASKYFPHFIGVNFLYYHLGGKLGFDDRPLTRRRYLLFFGTFALVFLAVNPTILKPEIWNYLVSYVREETLTHHGYLMMGQIYYNELSHTPGGLPVYFYVLYLFVKLPLLLLVALSIGLCLAWKQRKEHPGQLFLLTNFVMWLLPYSLVAAKWSRYTLSLMPWVYILSAVGLLWMLERLCLAAGRVWRRPLRRDWLLPSGVALITLILLIPIYRTAPYFSLFINKLGGGSSGVGYYFPHDDFYDLGLREAISFVARTSPADSIIISDAPSVVRYYSKRFGRPDLKQGSFCDRTPDLNDHNYVLFQEGRRYFENDRTLEDIKRDFKPAEVVRVAGYAAVQIYKIDKAIGDRLVSNENAYR